MKRQLQKGVIVCALFLLNFHLYSQSKALDINAVYAVRPITEINDFAQGDAYPWISEDGLRLYYNAYNKADQRTYIYCSTRANLDKAFDAHSILNVNQLTKDNLSPWLSRDEKTIVYVVKDNHDRSKTQLFTATRSSQSEPFSETEAITLSGNVKGTLLSPSLTQDQQELFVFNQYQHKTYLLVYERSEGNHFIIKGNLEFPSKYLIKTGKLSADGLKYFISLEKSSSSPKIFVATRERLGQPFQTLEKLPIKSINKTGLRTHQPFETANGKFIAFTRSNSNDWKENDIYIAQLVQDNHEEMIFEESEIADSGLNDLVIFPNPTAMYVSLQNPKQKTLNIRVFDETGKIIKEMKDVTSLDRLDISEYDAGIYSFYILDQQTKHQRIFRIIKVE